MTIITCLIAWYISGMAGFVFWWTRDYDITTDDMAIALYSGIIGPLAWPMGYLIHGGSPDPKILVKRRQGKV